MKFTEAQIAHASRVYWEKYDQMTPAQIAAMDKNLFRRGVESQMTEPYYVAGFMPEAVASSCFNALAQELAWVRRDTTPRMEYYVNSVPVPYTYGNGAFRRTYQPQPTHPTLEVIRAEVQDVADCAFEVCFLNRYLNQSDHLGWHADNSPEMDDARPICIVSLGTPRKIWFRENGSADHDELMLGHGSLCIMPPGFQDTHQHRIPKSGIQCGERISLTFRGYTGAAT